MEYIAVVLGIIGDIILGLAMAYIMIKEWEK